jgi:hypothetical protein
LKARSSHKDNSSGGTSPAINVERGAIHHLTPLKTKFCVPPLQSRWIMRLRLIKRMEEGFERKLTLLSAPAGFGKTTLLVDWVNRHKIPVAWFSVDKADNDPMLQNPALQGDCGEFALNDASESVVFKSGYLRYEHFLFEYPEAKRIVRKFLEQNLN